MPDQFFRASVGAVISDGKGSILAFERSDVPGAWQLPQGGIEPGEEPLDAVAREILEETGIEFASLVLECEYPDWLTYELPADMRSEKTGRGQTQRWFLFRYAGDAQAIELPSGEFVACRWVAWDELIARTAEFRRPGYEQLRQAFTKSGGA